MVSSTSSQPAFKPAATISLTVLAFAAVVALLYFGRVFFITLAIAVIIAFLLEPAVAFFTRFRLPRPLASFLVCSIALLGIYLLGLAVYSQFAGLAEDLPMYSQRLNALVDSVSTRADQFEKRTYELVVPKRFQDQPPPAPQPVVRTPPKGHHRAAEPVVQPPAIQEVRIHSEPKPLITYVYGYLHSFYDILLMASFVPFLVYFMLSWSDHLNRSFIYLFRGEHQQVAGRSWQGVAAMARAYVIGNFGLGFLLALASSLFFLGIRLPYWALIGPISGFLSLVPYVGLPLAMLPPLLAGLAVYNTPGMYLVIAMVIAFLHLTAMNLLYPKMVGSRVHLNPLAVTIALMFWGTLWGGIGLVLAIPITAGIKAVCDTVDSLQGYGQLMGD